MNMMESSLKDLQWCCIWFFSVILTHSGFSLLPLRHKTCAEVFLSILNDYIVQILTICPWGIADSLLFTAPVAFYSYL